MSNVSFFRNRFGFVMVGLVLLVCLILLVRQRLFPSVPANLAPVEPGVVDAVAPTPVDPAVLTQEWRQAVQAVLEDYDRTGDARAAKERLLTVRVPAGGRDAHLALYLAFNVLSESRPEGKTKLAVARATFAQIPAATPTTTSTTSGAAATSTTAPTVTSTRK